MYFFGGGKADGDASMKMFLGGKGANLAEMTSLGIPVPPGFTIATKGCEIYYENNKNYPESFKNEVLENLKKLETLMGKKLGDAKDPLLVSVRSGAAVSMPGMMDTILNLGLNDQAVEGISNLTNNPRFAYDAYRRFIQMFANVALGMNLHIFEGILSALKQEKGVEDDTDLTADDLKELVKRYKVAFTADQGKEFPQDPMEQLWASIGAVFGSWNNPSAIKYRQLNHIYGLLGTGVNVQSMVFGNFGDTSGTGVCFSRDPATGEKVFYGEYLMNAQGEDVVAGIRTPNKMSVLEEQNPEIYAELVAIKDRLEAHYKDMQDMEFTIQEGKLYCLQTRNGKRTGAAAIKIAVDLVAEGMRTKEEAVAMVEPDLIDQLFHPLIEPASRKEMKALTVGLNASPGAATGRIVFTSEEAEAWHANKEKVLLVRKETAAEDIGGMVVSEGILTSTGGKTSHAAVVARGMGTPCVAGCKALEINEKSVTINGETFNEGDWMTIDGTTGEVFAGKAALVMPEINEDLKTFLTWADAIRIKDGFIIRTNADQPEDAVTARDFGAEGIGLCRTEHMFFGEGKLQIFQQMILASNLEDREIALKALLPLQKEDFLGIFDAMQGYPVTVRLLDPPLHEFLPVSEYDIESLAKSLELTSQDVKTKMHTLHESNPMLGHRGCRLGITYPEIYKMQVEAIMEAACDLTKAGKTVLPEIMIPLIGTVEELQILRDEALEVAKAVIANSGISVNYTIGTMIEIPRAALTADEVATVADFFSFGTNDLTQMTFGYSRDDIGSFLPTYIERGILHHDPFASIDISGVGRLVSTAINLGRGVKAKMKMGVCGEHGGDPRSIEFFYKAGLNYVSCSPYRVPVARLAAAQAILKAKK